jgi:hypothetical protein
MRIVMHVIFFTQYCLYGISLYRQVMPPRQAMSIRNEEEDLIEVEVILGAFTFSSPSVEEIVR